MDASLRPRIGINCELAWFLQVRLEFICLQYIYRKLSCYFFYENLKFEREISDFVFLRKEKILSKTIAVSYHKIKKVLLLKTLP